MSMVAERKQFLDNTLSDGAVQWKNVFKERFLLRRNWLKGDCQVRTFEGHTQGNSSSSTKILGIIYSSLFFVAIQCKDWTSATLVYTQSSSLESNICDLLTLEFQDTAVKRMRMRDHKVSWRFVLPVILMF